MRKSRNEFSYIFEVDFSPEKEVYKPKYQSKCSLWPSLLRSAPWAKGQMACFPPFKINSKILENLDFWARKEIYKPKCPKRFCMGGPAFINYLYGKQHV